MRTLLILSLVLATNAFATKLKYTTTCEIKNRVAHGFVHNIEDAFEIDGYVWFYFFDERGNFIDKEDEYEYEYVSRSENDEVDTTSAPSRAVTCSFEIDGAIKNAQPTPTPIANSKYRTDCKLQNGYGVGFVHNLDDAFEIDGNVWFYFFDARGNFLDKEDEYEYEYVSPRSTEEIEKTRAPSRAASCSFEIKDAIKKR